MDNCVQRLLRCVDVRLEKKEKGVQKRGKENIPAATKPLFRSIVILVELRCCTYSAIIAGRVTRISQSDRRSIFEHVCTDLVKFFYRMPRYMP